MSTTATQEIPRQEWVSFFNAFSQRHARWLVTVEVMGADLGDQIQARSVRFEGINADLKDGEDVITIDLGDSPDGALTHTVAHPTHVWLGQSEAELGTFETLDIQTADGMTLVRFLAGVLPEGSGDLP